MPTGCWEISWGKLKNAKDVLNMLKDGWQWVNIRPIKMQWQKSASMISTSGAVPGPGSTVEPAEVLTVAWSYGWSTLVGWRTSGASRIRKGFHLMKLFSVRTTGAPEPFHRSRRICFLSIRNLSRRWRCFRTKQVWDQGWMLAVCWSSVGWWDWNIY